MSDYADEMWELMSAVRENWLETLARREVRASRSLLRTERAGSSALIDQIGRRLDTDFNAATNGGDITIYDLRGNRD